MRVSSTCPLRVASLVWRPRPEAFALTVVCKATFALEPGRSRLAPAQEAPWEADVPWGDDPRASLWAASDLAPFKRRVDVLVVGHAHAPHGEPAASLVARLAIGAIDKRIEVHGQRAWTPGGHLTAAAPFARASLRWERAARGRDGWNPVGIPANAAPDARGLRPAPSLLPPGAELRGPAEPLPPAGFGPIAPSWPERAARLRRHAATFGHDAWAERPLPEDIDPGYFNAAPPDQQLDQLPAGERLVLAHLHPQHPELATALEGVIPRASLLRGDAAPQEMRLRCDTLWIDADRGICTLTWRGAVPLRHAAEEVTVVVTAERPEAEAELAETLMPAVAASAPERGDAVAPAPGAAGGALPAAMVSTLVPDLSAAGGALPAAMVSTLVPDLSAAGSSGVLPFVAPSALPFAPAAQGAAGEGSGAPARPAAPAPAPSDRPSAPLPPAPPGPRPSAAASALDEGPDTLAPRTLTPGTLSAGLVPVPAEPLPFQAGRAAAAPVPDPGIAPPPPPPSLGQRLSSSPPPPPPLFGQPLPSPPPPPPPILGQRLSSSPPPPPPLFGQRLSSSLPPAAAAQANAPPPSTSPPPPPPSSAADPAKEPSSPLAAPAPAVRPEDVPMERFAAISAEIAERRAPRPEVLRAHGLGERAWDAVERRFRALLDKDARAGGRLRAAHDAAYVAAVEAFRGPIALEEYARIAVGLERGAAGEVLDALAIQRAALMPIVRVWTKKAAGNMALSAELMALLDKLRAE
ncbi:DUF2169 family type VI secretion system accessory protein [Sorangium sp. So ce542]|uniref:DUF2169 family type VI secretion system accessory protein n=1 Tax=Sorangium sp. So ce542 TaxID=3133316 RepID=UPI003F6459AD